MTDLQATNNTGSIRIFHIIDHLSLHGAQMYLVKLVRGLSELGYEQRVYGLNDPRHPKIVDMMTEVGVDVETIGKVRLLSGTGLLTLLVDLVKWRPHVVQTCLRFSDVIGRILGRLAHVPVSVSVVTQPNVDKYRWQFLLDRLTAGFSDRVVFNSKEIIPFALAREGIKPEQVVFIPNGIDIEAGNSTTAGSLRTRLHISPDAPVIGFVARFYPQKGHSILLSAFAKVLEEEQHAILLLIGDGPLRPELESQAAALSVNANVRFVGEYANLSEIWDSIDLYVQASLWEGMSIALMQAMLSEIPVVATAVDGTIELIEDEKTGFLVKPGDVAALAFAVVRALKNTELAKQIGKNGSAMINREYSVSMMVSRFDDMYRQLLGLEPRCEQ
ncbi:MAG TPA: glycosyltransferase [Desulfomonilaceae bacterium]|nr:glycosyltransferase [Desulfomonilaceae bacterium]